MAVYFIVNAEITDPETLARYLREVDRSFEGHDVKVLVSTNEADTIEGTPIGRRVAVLEFPDRDAFHAWYESAAYREVAPLRYESTAGIGLLVDGR